MCSKNLPAENSFFMCVTIRIPFGTCQSVTTSVSQEIMTTMPTVTVLCQSSVKDHQQSLSVEHAVFIITEEQQRGKTCRKNFQKQSKHFTVKRAKIKRTSTLTLLQTKKYLPLITLKSEDSAVVRVAGIVLGNKFIFLLTP